MIGAPGRSRAVYSAEVIRQARIPPDLLWGKSVRGLAGPVAKGPRRLVRMLGTLGRSGALN
jgi:hypothetical protein